MSNIKILGGKTCPGLVQTGCVLIEQVPRGNIKRGIERAIGATRSLKYLA